MIKVQNLYYDYPETRALNNINFELPQGSITALVGPNGSGKTTLLRSIACLDEPIHGDIFISDINIWEFPTKVRQLIGYLPDHFGLYQDLTVLQCVTYAGWNHNLKDDTLQKAIEWVIQKVNLEDKLNLLAGSLSRGQRQRLALAQVLIQQPKIVLLDEPASGLDPSARHDLSQLLKSLAKDGTTFIVSSHILEELEGYCTGILILEKGKLLSYHQTHKELKLKNYPLTISLLGANDLDLQRMIVALMEQGYKAQLQDRHILCEFTDYTEEKQHQLLLLLINQGFKITNFSIKNHSLQDVYFDTLQQTRITGAQ